MQDSNTPNDARPWPASEEDRRWFARVEIEFPAGVSRHPQLPVLVQDRIERTSVIDLRAAGVVVGFVIEHATDAEAADEVGAVASDLVGFLQLPETSIVVLEVHPAA
ncbi:MAG: hypothetical protein JNK12_14055 [Acidimicrobiales bacterium]|nr:hypothetical protein [Acidimicrobiales bacterium]